MQECFVRIEPLQVEKSIFKIFKINFQNEFLPLGLKNYDLLDVQHSPDIQNKDEPQLDNDYKCVICNKQFSQKNPLDLRNRIVQRNDNNDLKCNLCTKIIRLSSKSYLKTVHKKTNDFQCKICHKIFTKKDNFEAHTKKIHLKSKNPKICDKKCEQCGKCFNYLGVLKRHISFFHGNQKQVSFM